MKWIIAIGGSDVDGIFMFTKEGTKEEIKKYLVELAAKRVSLYYDASCWEYGTESVDEVAERCDGLYAYNVFTDSHEDYQATPLDVLKNVG